MNVLIFLMMSAAGCGQVAKAEGGQPAAPAVASLFNGKDLTGWTDLLDNASEWRVEGGVLEGRGGGKPHPAILGTDRQDYQNFRLRVVFSSPGPGGGWIGIRQTGDTTSSNSYCVSVATTGDWQAAGYPAGNVLKIKDLHLGVTPAPPAHESARIRTAPRQWHTLIVTAIGNRISTTVDGRPADDYTDLKQGGYRSGSFFILCRGDSVLRIRDIQIQELPSE